ncbi:hypothetical protein DYB36_003315 [Aphanomyces astaci]|uniref:Uncharacterized protein n=2 Tax=Aphanomyces astaci TaxID=112090 RepID=A0A397AM40_APHAT|nr:hypothetical protein DYB36_003315 [Aphanomyces astaci]
MTTSFSPHLSSLLDAAIVVVVGYFLLRFNRFVRERLAHQLRAFQSRQDDVMALLTQHRSEPLLPCTESWADRAIRRALTPKPKLLGTPLNPHAASVHNSSTSRQSIPTAVSLKLKTTPLALPHVSVAPVLDLAEVRTSGLRVLFFGTDAISLATLELLHANMQLTTQLAARGAECVLTTLRNVDNLLEHAPFEKRLNLMHEDSPLMAREGGERGRFCYDKPTKALWVTAIDGQWVLVTRVQVASRTIRTAAEFADGQRLRSDQLFHFDQPNDHDN